MYIYIVRHGQSQFNANHGEGCENIKACDLKLTDLGVKQAELAGKTLKSELESLSIESRYVKIITSPYERAKNTAEIIGRESEINEYIYVDDRITEQNYGLFSGSENTQDNMDKYPDVYKYYAETIDKVGRYYTRMPFGESEFDMVNRAASMINTLRTLSNEPDCKVVILVSHHNFIRAFMKVLLDENMSWYENEKGPGNCSIQKVEISTNNYKNMRYTKYIDRYTYYHGYIHGNKLEKWMV